MFANKFTISPTYNLKKVMKRPKTKLRREILEHIENTKLVNSELLSYSVREFSVKLS